MVLRVKGKMRWLCDNYQLTFCEEAMMSITTPFYQHTLVRPALTGATIA
jgi:hypothetical protein